MSRGRTAYYNGLAAEEIAAQAYLAQGGKLLARRWKVPEGEIDLIIGLEATLVFVEVKARKTLDAAKSALSARQQARLLACAGQYLALHASLNTPCRFDLVAVNRSGGYEILENVLAG